MNAARDGHPLGPLEDLIGLQLRLAQLHFFAEFYARFGHMDVSPAEHAVLSLVRDNSGIRQGELGRLLKIKRSNMTKTMRALERRGLITRTPPESDGRAFEVHLTAKGRKMQAELAATVYDADRQSAAALTDAEKKQLLALLKKLNTFRGSEAESSQERELVHG